MSDLYLATVQLIGDCYLAEGVGDGSLGVVVEVWDDDHFEVEFSAPPIGETIALLTLTRAEIEPVEQPAALPGARVGD